MKITRLVKQSTLPSSLCYSDLLTHLLLWSLLCSQMEKEQRTVTVHLCNCHIALVTCAYFTYPI